MSLSGLPTIYTYAKNHIDPLLRGKRTNTILYLLTYKYLLLFFVSLAKTRENGWTILIKKIVGSNRSRNGLYGSRTTFARATSLL